MCFKNKNNLQIFTFWAKQRPILDPKCKLKTKIVDENIAHIKFFNVQFINE